MSNFIQVKLHLNSTSYINTSKGIDLSIPIESKKGTRAWYVDYPIMEPVRANGFIGSVEEGGNVNFKDISFNPHGNGTHTECVGHISKEFHSVNNSLKEFFFKASLITCIPEKVKNEFYAEEDLVIDVDQIPDISEVCEALVIRTMPNDLDKKTKLYSGTNAPYLSEAAIEKIVAMGIQHLLIDLPSVDREVDEGVLNAHHIFWNYPGKPNTAKTITEFIYVPKEVKDGTYLLEIQLAAFENDASPSRPVLYEIFED